MSDITKIREWDDPDDREGDDIWPAPPRNVESRVTGDLRARILAKVGRRPADSFGVGVRLIEIEIEGGWSEFTVEYDYEIEVWVDEGQQSQRVFKAETYGSDSTMAEFLRWTEADTPNVAS